MTITDLQLETVLVHSDGREATINAGAQATLRAALINAADQIQPGMKPSAAMEAADLVEKIQHAREILHLEPEEVVTLKKNAAMIFLPTLFKQICKVIAPPPPKEIFQRELEEV